VVSQHRSTQRHEPKPAGDDAGLRAELRRFSKERPRWGYRRTHHRLREKGWEVNRKRVQRLWREEGLRVPQRRHKRRRPGESKVPAQRLRAERRNHVWAFDFQFDQTADGRALKLLNVVDEFTRESLAMLVERSIDADRAVSVLDALAGERGAPELLCCDNGPEMTGHALHDWCERSKAGTAFIEPGSPWQNPFVESFHARVRDELLDVEEFLLPGRGAW
jgi:putative transposase